MRHSTRCTGLGNGTKPAPAALIVGLLGVSLVATVSASAGLELVSMSLKDSSRDKDRVEQPDKA